MLWPGLHPENHRAPPPKKGVGLLLSFCVALPGAPRLRESCTLERIGNLGLTQREPESKGNGETIREDLGLMGPSRLRRAGCGLQERGLWGGENAQLWRSPVE